MLEAKDTSASALQKKKKKVLHKNFSGDLDKKTFSKKFFKRSTKFQQFKKIVLSSSRGQANFRGLEAKDLTFEAKDFKICPRGLHLCCLSLCNSCYFGIFVRNKTKAFCSGLLLFHFLNFIRRHWLEQLCDCDIP